MTAKSLGRTLLTLGVVLGMTTLLGGCDWFTTKKKEAEQPKQELPVPKITSCLQWQVEPMPETSPELSERHIRNDQCVEIERQIVYRVTHNIEDIALRPNGTKISSHVENSRGIVIQDVTYDETGKTVVSGFLNRNDGTALKTISVDPATKVTTITTYWWDGKSVFTVDVIQTDGSFTQEVHHKKGNLWMKRSGARVGTSDKDVVYDTNGVLLITREAQTGDNVLYTTYRPDGTVKLKQVFSITRYYYGSGNTTLVSAEIYSDDGKTVVKKLTSSNNNGGYGGYSPYYYGYRYNSSYVDTVETHNPDGTTTTRNLDRSGLVTHETIKDATGKVTSDKDFNFQSQDRPAETIDSGVSSQPSAASDDPQATWGDSEQNPQDRTDSL